MPNSGKEYNVDSTDDQLSCWHSSPYKYRQASADTIYISTIFGSTPHCPAKPTALIQNLDSAYIPTFADVQTKEWTLAMDPNCSPTNTARMLDKLKAPWKRFKLPSKSFKAAETSETRTLLASFIKFDAAHTEKLNMSWLSQANGFSRDVYAQNYRYGKES
ncbi:hypothetical protein FB451DRAFT_1406567 [Mycena latifolia]|nr:hypothetical protein FB451DRAFT_1406567 [Mycena latifolia]